MGVHTRIMVISRQYQCSVSYGDSVTLILMRIDQIISVGISWTTDGMESPIKSDHSFTKKLILFPSTLYTMYVSVIRYEVFGAGHYVTELVVVDELIFYCYGISGPDWGINTSCVLSYRNHIYVNAYDLRLVNITNCKNVHSYYNNDLLPMSLMFIMMEFSNMYSGVHRTDHLQKHQLDDRWDGIADRIREQLY